MKNLITGILISFSIVAVSCKTAKDTQRWTVASETRDCTGVGPQKCLLVKTGGHNDWIFMYEGIEGFDYEPGYEYVLEVRQEERAQPVPADRSTYKYVLVKVVSKIKKHSEDMPSMPLVR